MQVKSTYDKALAINLDSSVYGTLAEIGAGQEVANWFFKASATAGTVAKSISAYDMSMSDAIYGPSNRYVSRDRLASMLDHEYPLLLERLEGRRKQPTRFFAFCNTVKARGYKDTSECYGWLGVRFQLEPGAPPSQVVLHCRLLDWENRDQMEALGILGVNLLYALFFKEGGVDAQLLSLKENLGSERVEVDMIKFEGHGFGDVDERLLALKLVSLGLTEAAMFTPEGEVVQPSEVLYKKPVELLRGSFNPVTELHLDMLSQSRKLFASRLGGGDQGQVGRECAEICELSMSNLLRAGELDASEFIRRAEALQRLGKTVLVSKLAEFYRVSEYLSRYTSEPIAIVLSIGLLNELFKEKWSRGLQGGILESFGRLFKNDLCLYVYPWRNRKTGEVIDAHNFLTPGGLEGLYTYLKDSGKILGVSCSNDRLLDFTGRDLMKMRGDGNDTWKEFVPERIRDLLV